MVRRKKEEIKQRAIRAGQRFYNQNIKIKEIAIAEGVCYTTIWMDLRKRLPEYADEYILSKKVNDKMDSYWKNSKHMRKPRRIK